MLTKPELEDEHLTNFLQEVFGLPVVSLTFLELGGDRRTAVYRVTTNEDGDYFCKLRRGTNGVAAQVADILHARGIAEVIAPVKTLDGHLFAALGTFAVTLYPYVPGIEGYDVELSTGQWLTFGSALQQIHHAPLTPSLARNLKKETYSAEFRSRCATILKQLSSEVFDDPISAQLQTFVNTHVELISTALRRASHLSHHLHRSEHQAVLCHTDIHPGNLLIEDDGTLHIIDWDYPMLAPQERDLMFIGGAQGFQPYDADLETRLFYAGYGDADPDPFLLTYYRYERGIKDVAIECERVLSTALTERERSLALETLQLYFLPGCCTLKVALDSDTFGQ
jgi:spectinomycin phosphotransferase